LVNATEVLSRCPECNGELVSINLKLPEIDAARPPIDYVGDRGHEAIMSPLTMRWPESDRWSGDDRFETTTDIVWYILAVTLDRVCCTNRCQIGWPRPVNIASQASTSRA
jgi:hypothetical protein